MNEKVGILGGDLRNIELVKLLKQDGIEVSTYGMEKLQDKENKEDNDFNHFVENNKIIIGPIPFTRDEKNLNASFSKENIKIEELKRKLNNKILFTGNIGEKNIIDFERNNVKVYDFMNDESFVIKNAVATAEGAIEILINARKTTIYGSNILILGFGRIGKILANRLKNFEADIFCEARKEKDLEWIKLLGYRAIKFENIKENLNQMDIIINTVPSSILGKEEIQKIDINSVYLELASTPGGIDVNCLKNKRFNYILGAGIPGKMFYESTAKSLREIIYKNVIK